jgi:hypothetical protein
LYPFKEDRSIDNRKPSVGYTMINLAAKPSHVYNRYWVRKMTENMKDVRYWQHLLLLGGRYSSNLIITDRIVHTHHTVHTILTREEERTRVAWWVSTFSGEDQSVSDGFLFSITCSLFLLPYSHKFSKLTI